MSGLTLDSGALIAFERGERAVLAVIVRARECGLQLAVPAGVVGQVWRNGRKQARLARLLASRTVEVEPLDDARARAAGQLCGIARTTDVIDASVVLCARRRGHAVMTSDPDDIARLAPALRTRSDHLIVVDHEDRLPVDRLEECPVRTGDVRLVQRELGGGLDDDEEEVLEVMDGQPG